MTGNDLFAGMTQGEMRECVTCGDVFMPRTGNQKHCTPACTARSKAAREAIRRAGMIPAEQLPRCPICGRAVTAGGGAITCSEQCRRTRTAIMKRRAAAGGEQDKRLQVAQHGHMTDAQWLIVLTRVEARSGERTASMMLDALNARRAREGRAPLVRK